MDEAYRYLIPIPSVSMRRIYYQSQSQAYRWGVYIINPKPKGIDEAYTVSIPNPRVSMRRIQYQSQTQGYRWGV